MDEKILVTGYSNHLFSIKVPFSQKDVVKQDFHGTFDWDKKEWLVHEAYFEEFVNYFKDVLEISDQAKKQWNAFEKMLQIKNAQDAVLYRVPFAEKLRPYQRVGTAFLSSQDSKILADEMGLGKTVQTIATAIEMGAHKILVVAPNPLKQSWANEVAKWTDEYEATVVSGTKSHRIKVLNGYKNGFLIVNYEMLLSKKYRSTLSNIHFDLIVADEATFLKNRKAQRTEYFKNLNGDKKIFITGTPVTKTPADLFAPLNILFPYYFRSYWAFVRKYCYVDEINVGGRTIYKVYGVQNEKELKQELEGIMIRRTKKEVATSLPPLIEEEVSLNYGDMPKEQLELYQRLDADLQSAIEQSDKKSVLKNIVYMQEALETPENLGISAGSAKLAALKELLETYYEPGKSFIVWTQFVTTAYRSFDIAKKIFGIGKTAVITGQEKDRNRKIAAFQEGKIDALVITLKTGKFGFNLTVPGRSVVSIFVSRSFSFEEMEQAKQRVLRITTEKSPTVLYVSIPGTIDDAVKSSLSEKRDIFDVLLSKRK